jgi:hypothetical protein
MEWRVSPQSFRKIQAKGRKARWDAMTPKQRTAWGRKLNRIRWTKVRAAKAAHNGMHKIDVNGRKRRARAGAVRALEKSGA